MKEITQALLKEYFKYQNGELICIKRFGPNSKLGLPVGRLNSSGYKVTTIFKKDRYIHRLIWMMEHGEWPNVIDHINRNKSDNNIENLRNVSRTENGRNQSLHITNKSGVSGVCRASCGERWRATIWDKKQKHLGNFIKFEDACAARREAEMVLGYIS